jgi:Tfp pilus assembly protein PilF
MRPDDPGPIKDKKVREALRATNLPIVEEGIQNLQKALSIDPQYDDAMAYMNLLHRERADLADNAEEYKKEIAEADSWVDKTLATKKAKTEKAGKKAAE